MPAIELFSPFRDFDLMDRRMRRLFSDVSFPIAPALAPAADVYETDGELVVELEVPGYEEKELKVEVTDHTLLVKGERKEETKKEDKTLRLHERLESTFERRFVLPAETDSEHVSASYGKGLLTLHVPKRAQPKPRTIEIAKQ
jgi:HSP20 family protein